MLFTTLFLTLAVAGATRVEAIPVFAHRYGFTCQACHTEVPRLNGFGEAFLARGYRIPGIAPRAGVVPIATKIKLAYGSDPDPSNLPKAIVDEIELLTGGTVGTRGSYFVETYLIDGGRPGSVRDAWGAYHIGAYERARTSATLTGGQFTLPLPLDPETFRETQAHYAIWDTVAGRNPFNFFDPHQGVALELGSGAATTLTLAALAGHDRSSGLPAYGFDRMATGRHAVGPFVASVYRYDGARRFEGAIDRFWRQGYGLGVVLPSLALQAVYQHGFDTDDGSQTARRTSGGFMQARYALGERSFAIARYDATESGAGPYRALVLGVGQRFSHNTRLTLEDVFTHTPTAHHALGAALQLAY